MTYIHDELCNSRIANGWCNCYVARLEEKDKRIEELEAERDIHLSRHNDQAKFLRECLVIQAKLKAERDQLAAELEQLTSDYDSQNLTDLNVALDALAERNEQLELARQALINSNAALTNWIKTYAPEFCDIEESRERINEHGTLGYIASALDINRNALAQLTPTVALEEHDRVVRQEAAKRCVELMRIGPHWVDALEAIEREFGLEGE